MPRVSLDRLRAEVLALYNPPVVARNSWFKFRQVLDILAALGLKSSSDLTPAAVARFVAFNPDWAPATAKGLVAYLSPVCKYARDMGYLRVNPFDLKKDWLKGVEARAGREDDDRPFGEEWEDPGQHVSLADLSRLLAHLEAGSIAWKGGRLHALTALVAYTGLRRNEGLTRTVNDFDLKRRLLRVKARRRKLKTEKSEQPVGLPEELVPILEAWLPRSGSKWAFPGVRGYAPWTGGPMGGRALDELKAAGRAAGIEHLTFQMLRHSWATHAELRGIGELMVQRQLRHTTARTQLHYRHADLVNLAEAVKDFSLRAIC